MGDNSFEAILHEFNRFLASIHEIDTDITEDINKLLCVDELFILLRIARISDDVINNSPVNISNRSRETNYTLYTKTGYDESRVYNVTKKNGKENMAILHVYPNIGEIDWTEFEINTINSIISVLYMYNGIFNLTKLTKKLVYYDRDMNIPNLTAFNRKIGELAAQNTISEYGTCRFNIKRFFNVNSLVGVPRGSIVMKQYITELQRIMGNDGIIYRVGGDYFLIIFLLVVYSAIVDYIK